MSCSEKPQRIRQLAVHGVRIFLFAAVIVLIHRQHMKLTEAQQNRSAIDVSVEEVRSIFPEATTLGQTIAGSVGREVLDSKGEPLGYVLQTSPASDSITGFSGPTNVLIAFDGNDRIRGIRILSSGDTREHVRQIQDDALFLKVFHGMTWETAAAGQDVDTVSGATLTSLAIQEAIIRRLGGGKPSLRFPDPLTLETTRKLFAAANAIQQDETYRSLWHVTDRERHELGTILRTAPAADQIIGYQGPTETLIGFDHKGAITGILLGKSYDNAEYVKYVREDDYFLTLFNGLNLDKLTELDLKEAEVEGVSGATMTSMTVARGVVRTAEEYRINLKSDMQQRPLVSFTAHDLGTAIVILAGLVIGMTSLRSKRIVRFSFQLILVGYLGLINGDLLSQAMLAGWARNGIPWRNAGGLALLSAAALLVPIFSGSNLYCNQLCPHGALQQLLRNRLPWRVRLPKRVARVLVTVPIVLLVLCMIVAMTSLPLSLVDIEPFDAWVLSIAGWPTVTIAVVGLIASLFVPMAYCRYGCPTGALLKFLRLHSQSDRWTRQDWIAVGMVLLALTLWVI